MKKSLKHYEARSSANTFLLTVGAIFLFWLGYRLFSRFPEWVDEVLVKAVVFGLPAWLYAHTHKDGIHMLGLDPKKFWKGMFTGLLIGGLYEFIAVFSTLVRGAPMANVMLFKSPEFWGVFMLAIFTAWWESMFFFGYVFQKSMELFKKSEWVAVLYTTFVFLMFHAPLRVINYGFSSAMIAQMFLLALFAIGQAILFVRTKSLYAVAVSHALWGLVLLIYSS